jgi:hypothetical protein
VQGLPDVGTVGRPSRSSQGYCGDGTQGLNCGEDSAVAADEKGPETWKASQSSLLDKPWVCGPSELSAPPAPPDPFPGRSAAGTRQPSSGFLGKAVGNIHDPDTIEF